jgi:hypothetical protein
LVAVAADLWWCLAVVVAADGAAASPSPSYPVVADPGGATSWGRASFFIFVDNGHRAFDLVAHCKVGRLHCLHFLRHLVLLFAFVVRRQKPKMHGENHVLLMYCSQNSDIR